MLASELAKTLGVSEATVSRIASGDRRPSIDLMMKIRTVLRWSIEDQANQLRESTTAYAAEFSAKMARRTLRRSDAG